MTLKTVLDTVKALLRAFARQEQLVVSVVVAGDQVCGFSIGAARTMVSTPATSAAKRAAISFSTSSCVQDRDLPAMWPHFFTAASWSSKVNPGGTRGVMFFISSEGIQHATRIGLRHPGEVGRK